MPPPYPIGKPLRNRRALAPDSRHRPGAHVEAWTIQDAAMKPGLRAGAPLLSIARLSSTGLMTGGRSPLRRRTGGERRPLPTRPRAPTGTSDGPPAAGPCLLCQRPACCPGAGPHRGDPVARTSATRQCPASSRQVRGGGRPEGGRAKARQGVPATTWGNGAPDGKARGQSQLWLKLTQL